ncbi:MAG: acyltransferase, partial [Rectinemataceae bacterium]|nr:acyltransferase [Rectinemataceae bacterium]
MATHSSKRIQPITSARPVQHLAESRARPGVLGFFRLIAPLYIHAILGFRSVSVRNAERLVKAYDDFFSGKTRLLITFRHPYGDEAQIMGYAIGRLLDRKARERGLKWKRQPHAHFIHGYEVPLWAGAFERWLLPRVGAVPVYHTKFDAKSIERIRALAKDGEFPIALAPEGQVSYVSEELPRLESGAAQIGAWCVHDLAREGRSEKVVILPVSVHHRWDDDAEKPLDRLIERIEAECGAGG